MIATARMLCFHSLDVPADLGIPVISFRRCQHAVPPHIIDDPLTSRIKNDISANRRDDLMKFEMSNFRSGSSNLPVEGEVCDIGYMTLSTRPQAETG